MGINHDYNKIFARNVKAMMAAESPPMSQPTLAGRGKMHQRTLSRIINEEVSPTLDQMTKIAVGLEVSLWQLLVEGADPSNLPVLAPVTEKERELWKTIQQAAQELGNYGKSQ